MQQIRTRQDLFDFVARHAPTQACKTAIAQGRATLLGRYQLAGGLPFWIVQAVSAHRKIWYVAVEGGDSYKVRPTRTEDFSILCVRLSDGVL